MGLLYPGALVFAAIVPALVLAYLARERPSRVTVSSVLAFRALRGMRKERFGGRPRLDWMFFAELIILLLAVLAMAGPYLIRRSNPIAVVIDNSAAMQAKLDSGRTRYDEAQSKLAAMLADEDTSGEVSVYATAPTPHRIAPPFESIAEARHALANVTASDAPDDRGAVAAMLGDLCAGGRYRAVLFAASRPVASPAPPNLHAISVGDPVANLALGSFVLRREVFGAEALHARIEVANFGPEPKPVEVTISGDGRKLAAAHESLAAGETGSLEFPSLPPAGIYRADLSPADSFALDNTAYATAGSVRKVKILFVSPTPADARGLDSIPGVSVATRAPDEFVPADLNDIDVAIFEFSAPKELPAVNTLLVMPPPGDPVFGFSVSPAANIQIARWSRTDPLTDSVNFRLLDLRRGEFIGVHPWMAAAAAGRSGGLLLHGEREGHRFVATGFNPFPYLGRGNLPMSVLTLNVLSYLAGLGANSAGYRTGQPWLVPAGVDRIKLPSGLSVEAKPGTLFTDVAAQGIYWLSGSTTVPTARAVNLDNLAVSDLENAAPVKIEAIESSASASAQAFTEKHSVSPWVLVAIIALAGLESLIVYRRRRPLQA
jgi:Aerotolerance regulator N-terminal/von Willebrand factor type A domain